MTDCLFCRIVAGDVPATAVHETGTTLAFRDVTPQAPTHVLVIPKEHFATAAELAHAAPQTMVQLWQALSVVAQAEGLAGGYRVVFNTGDDGGQTVPHVHAHLLGGRRMIWPPG